MAIQKQLQFNDKPKAVTLFAQQKGTVWHITGETWSRRKLLARVGGMWSAESKSWVFLDGLPSEVKEQVSIFLQEGEEAPVTSAEETATEEETAEMPTMQSTVTLPNMPTSIIAPSYWDLLWMYTTPSRCRPGIALVGPAGNGKTTVAEEVLKMREIEYLVIDANVTMEPFDLIGGMSYESKGGDGHQVWVDGPVTRAFREGKGVIINEFDSLDPRTALCLQSALQGKGTKNALRYITLSGNPNEDRVYPQGDCPIIMTMNTFGSGATRLYTGRNVLDAASRDRLTIISTRYENEDAILVSHGYSRFLAKRLLAWATDVRQQVDFHELPVILGMRGLLAIAELVEFHGIAFEKAVEMEFYSVQEADVISLLQTKAQD